MPFRHHLINRKINVPTRCCCLLVTWFCLAICCIRRPGRFLFFAHAKNSADEDWIKDGEDFLFKRRLIQLISEGVDVNAGDRRGNTLLHAAAEAALSDQPLEDVADMIQLLLDSGADVNIRNNAGDTALNLIVVAFRGGTMMDMARSLLDSGADVNANKGSEGSTPLHSASGHCYSTGMAELLLDRGADVNARDEFGWTSLHRACYSGCYQIIKMIFATGAVSDVNAKNQDGSSPLHLASMYAKPPWFICPPPDRREVVNVAKMLIRQGADVNAKDSDGNTPLELAMEFYHDGLVRFLLDSGAERNVGGFCINSGLLNPLPTNNTCNAMSVL